MNNMKSRILGEREKLSQNTQTTEAQEQKPKSRIRKLASAMIIASVAALSTQTLLPPVYAADATQAAIEMVQTKYSTAGVQQANYKLSVDGVDKTSELTFVSQNSRSMIGLRSFANVLGAQVDWDNSKVAIITKGSTKIEVPIGSPSILVNGQPKAIDDNGTISIILDSSTYLPFRIIAESLGYTVGYDANTKTILVTSGGGSQQQPQQQTPTENPLFKELDTNKYNVSIPAGMENTTWLITYNTFRDIYGCTHEQAMQSMQHVSPAPKWEADNSNDGDTNKMSEKQRAHYNQIAKANTLARRNQVKPEPQEDGFRGELRDGGWFFNGQTWTDGDSLMAGTDGLAR